MAYPEKISSPSLEGMVKERGFTSEVVSLFRKLIYDNYREYGRHFPWRETDNPYHILVSEIMLQQTQTERVKGKYEQFIETFPDFSSLSRAQLRDVLNLWQGSGYNRRAINLKETAQRVIKEFQGHLPPDVEILKTLPGIGHATASAIAAFAFNLPVIFVETNIRQVFIHFFFPNEEKIKDAQILHLVEKTLDVSNPRAWYYGLMDYGVRLKKEYQNLGRRSAHYRRQTPFQGSDRQIRGMILKILIEQPDSSEEEIIQKLRKDPERVRSNLTQLQRECLIQNEGGRFSISQSKLPL